MRLKNVMVGVLSAAALVSVSAAAHASEALIQGVGFWGAGTATTAYSGAGKSFQFSFDVPDPLNANPTTDVTNFFYSLNGVKVATSASDVEFFDLGQSGMFNIDFPTDVIAIYGADIGSTGVIGPDGSYGVTAFAEGSAKTSGVGVVTVTVSAAPEPSTWALMIAGVATVGGMLRFGRRRSGALAVA